MLRPNFSSASTDVAAPPLRGFVELDDLISQLDASGTVTARVPTQAVASAVAAHAERRCAELGRTCVASSSPPNGSLWREVALRCGILELPSDVEDAADKLVSALEASATMVIGALAESSQWDEAVARAIAHRARRGPGGALVVLLSVESPACSHDARVSSWETRAVVFSVDEAMSPAAAERWWTAIATAGRARAEAALPSLDAWWTRSARKLAANEAAMDLADLSVDDADRSLYARLSAVARPWPIAKIAALGALGSIKRLESSGAVTVLAGQVSATRNDAPATTTDLVAAAEALGRSWPTDPWAHARAAELLVRAGADSAAEIACVRAVTMAEDIVARGDLWARWANAVEDLPEALRQGCRLRAAELALTLGDADGALYWGERAVAAAPEEFATSLVLGKASLGRGDLVAADVALERALALAGHDGEKARALAELAEVRYRQGDLPGAESLARKARADAQTATTRLAAQNTLGKLLLARGQYREAESHFAGDAGAAGAAGDTTAVLRARLNRAIAVLSDGRTDEARPMLESVLEEGGRRGDQRAVAFALSNLAVLAINRHHYAEALDLSERAISVRRRLGERLGVARMVSNLAELRLRLGLIDEADQALTFGKAAVSRGSSIPRSAHFALVAARIRLARGDTLSARRELAVALAGASTSNDGDMADMVNECHRVAARISLEDGDVERAARDIEQAEQQAQTPGALADLSLLRSMQQRAAGLPALEEAEAAVMLARRAGDEELLLEAHAFVAQIAAADGDGDRVRRHVQAAAVLRDEVSGHLSDAHRATYLARRELLPLAQLERALREAPAPVATVAVPRDRKLAPLPSSRCIVGDDPAILAMVEGIRRVALSDATVLIHGESGTGKELVAEALHDASERCDAPLVKVNCAALVESLLLSELFGHEKGAFTGAVAKKRGRFELAEGGTLFLDEIGDVCARTQVSLLRVLQERTFERVGGSTPLRANVRIVCATNRDLRAMVERGEFRQDLYFRLTGIVVHVPALRDRLGDLPLLVRTLLTRIAGERGDKPKTLSAEALTLLARHRWPGNVRELENALRAASLFADGAEIRPLDLLTHVEGLRGLGTPTPVPPPRASNDVSPSRNPREEDDGGEEGSLDGAQTGATDLVYAELKAGKLGLFDVKRQLERDCIARALAETRGNITRAATILGMKRPRLSQLVKQYGLQAVSSEGH